METMYAKAVALAVPVFLLLIAVELAADRWRRTGVYSLADSINSLSCGIASTGMRVFFGFIGLFTYEWVLRHRGPAELPAGHWGTWLFAFFAYDLCYYWNHRLGHRVGLLWASHAVHHQSEEFNLTTALRQPATGAFTSWVFYLPLALAGVPVPVYLMVGVTQLFYQFWPHTRLIGRLGFLDRWIQTPSNHRVHHAQNDIYLDRNYVGVFAIWDRMFGTFQEEVDEEPCIYGIRGQLKSWNPVWANLHYYAAMARDSWHAGSWADKVRVWFAPPGWRPADVAARFPKQAYDPTRDFVKYDPARPLALSLYVLAQFTALMAANSQFLELLPKQSAALNVVYFVFLMFSLVCLGGLLENRRQFAMLEAARMAGAAIGAMVAGAWFGGVGAKWIVGWAVVSVCWLQYCRGVGTRRSRASVTSPA
jgi:sterol desaturase/sphingolipid hydroxylase (fatty acid hydroxylase superfamily)